MKPLVTLSSMQSKDRTLIPRSSPPKFKSKSTTAPYSPTPHHNAPIPLRGTGKPALTQPPPSRAVGDAPPSSTPLLARPGPSEGTRSIGITTPFQRINGSRIPAPMKFQTQGRAGYGLGFVIPTSTSGPKVAPGQTSPARTGRPSFHVPVIHSPGSKPAPTVQHESNDAVINSRDNGGPMESVESTIPSQSPGTGNALHNKAPDDTRALVRTVTAASNVSSESQYTSQSAAELAECRYTTSPKSLSMDSKNRDEETDRNISDTQNNGVDCEDENVALSPGFDVIQALANTAGGKNIDQNVPSENTLNTPLPRPYSRDKSGLRRPVNVPIPPLATVDALASHSSPRTPKIHRLSLLAEATNKASSHAPSSSSPHSQKSKSKTPSPHPRPQTPGNIPDIISEIETLVGHPCVDRDAINAAYCEAGAEPKKSTYTVFGVKLCVTTRYASCSSVLGDQIHTIPLVVFACIEELYRAGLRSSRLLRPPSHAPVTPPTHTDTQSSKTAQSPTHRFPELVASFNSEPKYGGDVNLALASLDDVSALLLTYLDCLPGGVIPVWVRNVLGEAVGVYEEGYRDGGSESARERKKAIHVAQLALRLLPPPYFSLLVYLFAFLSQIPLYEAWNGWNVRGVARSFARVVVGVGSGADTGDGKGKQREENGMDKRHRDDEVDWVAEEEDAVEVLEWLLGNWDDISEGLSFGAPQVAPGRRDSEAGRQQGGKGGMEMDKDAPGKQPESPHVAADNATNTASTSSNTMTSNPSVNALLARIASLENKNTEWQRSQAQHEAQLQHIFEIGEQKIGEAEEALREERNARARAEDALVKERMANAVAQTNTEDAVQAERKMWVQEVCALREAWERLGNVWDSIGKYRDDVGNILEGIVRRFAMGASNGSVAGAR